MKRKIARPMSIGVKLNVSLMHPKESKFLGVGNGCEVLKMINLAKYFYYRLGAYYHWTMYGYCLKMAEWSEAGGIRARISYALYWISLFMERDD